MHRTIVRAALLCGATGIALGVWAADDTAAHADDHGTGLLPAAVDLTGDLADTPVRTVEHAPRRVAKLTDAAPEPVRTAAEPAKRIVETVVDTVQPPKTPRPIAAPLKQRRAPATKPAPEAVPAVVLLTGDAPSTVTVDPARAADRPAAVAYALPCGDAGAPAGGLRRPSTPEHARSQCTPDGRSDTPTGLAQVKPPTKTGVDQLAATTTTSPATPALRMLGELLPRSDLPTGRATPPEPGPA